jgi:hypothetical protein
VTYTPNTDSPHPWCRWLHRAQLLPIAVIAALFLVAAPPLATVALGLLVAFIALGTFRLTLGRRGLRKLSDAIVAERRAGAVMAWHRGWAWGAAVCDLIVLAFLCDMAATNLADEIAHGRVVYADQGPLSPGPIAAMVAVFVLYAVCHHRAVTPAPGQAPNPEEGTAR